MNAGKHVFVGRTVVSCLAVIVAGLALQSCGNEDNPCRNPAAPGCGPSPSPSPQQVTRVVSQGSGSLPSHVLAPIIFTTTAAGNVGVEVDWTFATNNVDIYLARG